MNMIDDRAMTDSERDEVYAVYDTAVVREFEAHVYRMQDYMRHLDSLSVELLKSLNERAQEGASWQDMLPHARWLIAGVTSSIPVIDDAVECAFSHAAMRHSRGEHTCPGCPTCD